MDYSPPESSVHGISQARILQGVAMPFSKFLDQDLVQGLPEPGIELRSPAFQAASLPSELPLIKT